MGRGVRHSSLDPCYWLLTPCCQDSPRGRGISPNYCGKSSLRHTKVQHPSWVLQGMGCHGRLRVWEDCKSSQALLRAVSSSSCDWKPPQVWRNHPLRQALGGCLHLRTPPPCLLIVIKWPFYSDMRALVYCCIRSYPLHAICCFTVISHYFTTISYYFTLFHLNSLLFHTVSQLFHILFHSFNLISLSFHSYFTLISFSFHFISLSFHSYFIIIYLPLYFHFSFFLWCGWRFWKFWSQWFS